MVGWVVGGGWGVVGSQNRLCPLSPRDDPGSRPAARTSKPLIRGTYKSNLARTGALGGDLGGFEFWAGGSPGTTTQVGGGAENWD